MAKAKAEWILDGTPATDVHEWDLHRFEEPATARSSSSKTSSQAFVEVYDIVHPHQCRTEPRDLRISLRSIARRRALGACAFLRGRMLGAAGLVRGQRTTGSRTRRYLE